MDLSPWLTDSTLFDLYGQEASASIQKLLCFDLFDTGSGTFYGVVQDDGVTVRLPYWVTAISEVTIDGSSQQYSFTPTTGDVQTSDDPPTKYGSVLTLTDKSVVGSVVTIVGEYGFTELPDSLKALLAAIVQGVAERLDGTDYVKSKSIEDVSETRADIVSESTPLELIRQAYSGTIEKWSLCAPGVKNGLGELSYPHPLFNPPWWTTDADYGRIGR